MGRITSGLKTLAGILGMVGASYASGAHIAIGADNGQFKSGQVHSLWIGAENTGLENQPTDGLDWRVTVPSYIEVLSISRPESDMDFFQGPMFFEILQLPPKGCGRIVRDYGAGPVNSGPNLKPVAMYTFRINPDVPEEDLPVNGSFNLSDTNFWSPDGNEQPHTSSGFDFTTGTLENRVTFYSIPSTGVWEEGVVNTFGVYINSREMPLTKIGEVGWSLKVPDGINIIEGMIPATEEDFFGGYDMGVNTVGSFVDPLGYLGGNQRSVSGLEGPSDSFKLIGNYSAFADETFTGRGTFGFDKDSCWVSDIGGQELPVHFASLGFQSSNYVPEPSTLLGLGIGAGGLAVKLLHSGNVPENHSETIGSRNCRRAYSESSVTC